MNYGTLTDFVCSSYSYLDFLKRRFVPTSLTNLLIFDNCTSEIGMSCGTVAYMLCSTHGLSDQL